MRAEILLQEAKKGENTGKQRKMKRLHPSEIWSFGHAGKPSESVDFWLTDRLFALSCKSTLYKCTEHTR